MASSSAVQLSSLKSVLPAADAQEKQGSATSPRWQKRRKAIKGAKLVQKELPLAAPAPQKRALFGEISNRPAQKPQKVRDFTISTRLDADDKKLLFLDFKYVKGST